MSSRRRIKLFRIEGGQCVCIPCGLELPGDEAIMRKVGERLIIEPVPRGSLLELLATLEPIDDQFPEIEELPHDDVDL